jgi:hypothetical protein
MLVWTDHSEREHANTANRDDHGSVALWVGLRVRACRSCESLDVPTVRGEARDRLAHSSMRSLRVDHLAPGARTKIMYCHKREACRDQSIEG